MTKDKQSQTKGEMARLLRDRYLWYIIALIGMAAISVYLVEDYKE